MYSVVKASRAFLPAWSPRSWSARPFASEPVIVCASFRADSLACSIQCVPAGAGVLNTGNGK